ncbi:DMT family transporter [Brevibacillus laterosporus]|uniref:DMT family transporter n=1 Tax=Brevibacillus laterosporus TaxID=1465 RepID=UPI0018F89BFC|nr:DMT family transporter [Brevibacillus laterosporus]MBG9773970.1 transporter [Brevibacillus laterosporus]
MQTKSVFSAYIAAIVYSIIIGFSFLFVKLALQISTPLDVIAHRFTISFVVMLILVICGWIPVRIKWTDLKRIIPLALFYPAIFFVLQVFGLQYTSSSEAGIIQATVPIFTLLIASLFLKERSSGWQKASLFLSVAGVIFIFVMKGSSSVHFSGMGTLLIMLSCLSFSAYSVLARSLTKIWGPLELTFIMMSLGFVCFNVLSLSQHLSNGTISAFFTPWADMRFLLATLYLSILSSVGTAFLSNYVLSKIEATKMSVFNNLSTLISMLAGVIFLHEELGYYHYVGAVMIVAGVIGTSFLGQKRQQTQSIPKS